MNNSKIFDYAYLSVASYADLSEAMINPSDEEKNKLVESAIEDYSDYSPTSKTTSNFSKIVTDNHETVAHWQDRGDPMNWRDLLSAPANPSRLVFNIRNHDLC